jgi:serine/threonine protein kinase
MSDDALMVLAQSAGQTVAAAAVTDTWEAVRGRFAWLLGRGDAGKAEAADRWLAQTREKLTSPGPGLEQVRQAQTQRWAARFADLLDEDPSVEPELRTLVEEVASLLPTAVSAAGNSLAAGRDVTITASPGGLAAVVIHGTVASPISPHYQDQVPLDISSHAGKELQSLLSSQYPRRAEVETLVRRAGGSPRKIDWDEPITTVWLQVIRMMANEGKLRTFVQYLIDGPDEALADRLRRLMALLPEVDRAEVDDPQPWMTIDYADAPSLAQVVQEHGPLPPESLMKLAAGLAEGLSAIHAAGIVHRDLKPSNILLVEDGLRIIDFGIARSIDVDLGDEEGLVFGTPAFMSPEQARGLHVGPASDVFSLGAVLVYAATGEGPFGDDPPHVLLYRLDREPPRLDRVPDVLRPVIERSLAKDPNSRPSTTELLAALGPLGPSAGRRSPGGSSDAAQGESGEETPHVGPQEESKSLGRSGKKRIRPLLWSDVTGGQSNAVRIALGLRKRNAFTRAAVLPLAGQETVSRYREREAPRSTLSPVRPLRKLAIRVFGWIIPPAALAVLQSDHEALQGEALRFIEAEIDRAYAALGPPPGAGRIGRGRAV